MAETVLLPKIGITVESCLIGAWNKKIGDHVSIGDVLFSYETDKAVFDCESTAEGILQEIFFGEGEEARVLSPVCTIGGSGEGQTTASAGAKISPRAKNLAASLGIDYSLATPSGPHGRIIERDVERLAQGWPGAMVAQAASTAAVIPADPVAAAAAAAATAATTAAIQAAPVVPATSAAIQAAPVVQATSIAPAVPVVPATSIAPANPVAPVAQAASSASGEATPTEAAPLSVSSEYSEYTDEKLPQIRRVIAKTMHKSLSEMAQLTHHHSFDATALIALRAEFKQYGKHSGLDGVTIGDIILYAVAKVLRDFPDFNAHLIGGETMRRFRSINLGVAIDTPRGLLVPTLFNAGEMPLKQLSAHVKELAGAARSGSISPDLLSGSTFTVSNLGATSVEMFTPIINPPQVAILGVCGITTRIRESAAGGGVTASGSGRTGGGHTAGGGLVAYPSMGLSLTYDHRAVDGAPASVFVQKICETLEHINILLIDGN